MIKPRTKPLVTTTHRLHPITPITYLTPDSPAPSPPRRTPSPPHPAAPPPDSTAAAASQTCSITPTTSANGRRPRTGPERATTKPWPTGASTTPSPLPLPAPIPTLFNPPSNPHHYSEPSPKNPTRPPAASAPTQANTCPRSKTPHWSGPKRPSTRPRAGSTSSDAPRSKRC